MPELPEVETTKRGIAPYCDNAKIRKATFRHHQLRWPIEQSLTQTLQGLAIQRLYRRGKYLILETAKGSLLWHLGMSGSIRVITDNAAPQNHDHIDLLMDNGAILRYNDPRRFGAFLWTHDPVTQHALIAHLGPEPLSDAFDSDYLYQQSRKKTKACKTWIMDSKLVVGVGNIYANESLFLAGIHPLKPAGKLTKKQIETWTATIKQVLQHAIDQGGTTLKDFVNADGKPGYFAQQLNVYGRGGQACNTCGKKLLEKQLNKRTTVYCTACQK